MTTLKNFTFNENPGNRSASVSLYAKTSGGRFHAKIFSKKKNIFFWGGVRLDFACPRRTGFYFTQILVPSKYFIRIEFSCF